MPLIQVTLLEGRTPEQKRKVVERITAVMVEELGTKREAVTITFVDVPPTNYATGGVLVLDRGK
ncbi:MAG: 2-hydroxymuconate tautomerase family protein [Acidobacteria bacterium]|nr:2-hydroxymuconate tautomerase family protein [Acidobacteriota bacterium]